jgi:citrate synthase
MSENKPEIFKGLAGVPVDYTAISKVNPESNSLLYRGYPVQELAAKKSFEEVAWLLWKGELPKPTELAGFEQQERAMRALDSAVKRVIDELPLTAHPMDVCRTAVSVIGAMDASADDASPEANLAKSIRLFAKLPAIVAYDQRRRHKLPLIDPRSGVLVQLPMDDFRRSSRSSGSRRIPCFTDSLRGALIQRVDLHRPRDYLDTL